MLVHLDDRHLSALRRHRPALLRGQPVREGMLLRWHVHRGRHFVLVEHQRHLWKLQERPVHLRQRGRALLSKRRATRRLLFELRPELHHLLARLHEFRVCSLREVWRALLRRQHVQRRRNPMPLRLQLDDHQLRLQGVWCDRTGLLLVVLGGRGVPRCRHDLQLVEHLRSVRRDRADLLLVLGDGRGVP